MAAFFLIWVAISLVVSGLWAPILVGFMLLHACIGFSLRHDTGNPLVAWWLENRPKSWRNVLLLAIFLTATILSLTCVAIDLWAY